MRLSGKKLSSYVIQKKESSWCASEKPLQEYERKTEQYVTPVGIK